MSAGSTTDAGRRAYATPLTAYSAAKVTSMRESACPAIRLHPLHQVLDEILKHRGVELVLDLLPVSFSRDQAGFFQHAEMPRYRRPAGFESRRDLAGRTRRRAQETQNLAASRIRECPEHGVPNLHT